MIVIVWKILDVQTKFHHKNSKLIVKLKAIMKRNLIFAEKLNKLLKSPLTTVSCLYFSENIFWAIKKPVFFHKIVPKNTRIIRQCAYETEPTYLVRELK